MSGGERMGPCCGKCAKGTAMNRAGCGGRAPFVFAASPGEAGVHAPAPLPKDTAGAPPEAPARRAG